MFKINKKYKYSDYKKGMTYVELIVVLSIFAIMSSVVMFNYGFFQSQVDIKNLASDVALKLVQAQKYSVSGKLPSLSQQWLITDINAWRPSYGVYFKTSTNQSFIYFTDINQNHIYNSADGELSETININKNNRISNIKVNGIGCASINELNVVFKRPNSGAIINTVPEASCSIENIQITVSSSSSTPATGEILVYPSGRIQIN